MLASLSDSTKIKLRSHKLRTILIYAAILITAIGGVIAYQFLTRSNNPIPVVLQSKLNFSPFVVSLNSKNYTTTDYKFTNAENNVQVLSYVIHLKNNNSVLMSEYTQPPEFTEIPEYQNRFLTNIANQYDTIQTSNGVIYLGRLTKQNNKQLGVMLEKGLLVLLSPDKDLGKVEWRQLGDEFVIQKLN